jgi:YD repeat-containing protein
VTTASGSGVNSNDILSAIEYPDPSTGQPSTSSSQQETYLVNALGQTVQSTDRNGNVHQYNYDVLRRLTSDAVTTLGAGVDGSVRRIGYAYDSQGNLSLITSYDAASGGNIVNQVLRQYNGLDQLTAEYQGHHGAVNTSQTGTVQTSVQYVYNEMANGQNNSRLVSIVYPSTWSNARYTLSYNYASGLNDRISGLSSLSDNSPLSNGATLESYQYLGLGTVVERDHSQVGKESEKGSGLVDLAGKARLGFPCCRSGSICLQR